MTETLNEDLKWMLVKECGRELFYMHNKKYPDPENFYEDKILRGFEKDVLHVLPFIFSKVISAHKVDAGATYYEWISADRKDFDENIYIKHWRHAETKEPVSAGDAYAHFKYDEFDKLEILKPVSVGHKVQDPCNFCGKDLREQMKGCSEVSCYRQHLNSVGHPVDDGWIEIKSDNDLPEFKSVNGSIEISIELQVFDEVHGVNQAWCKRFSKSSKDPLFPERKKGYWVFENRYGTFNNVTHYKPLPQPPIK